MKTWILDKLTGIFGIPITAALSGLAGALVAKLYAMAGAIPFVAELAAETAKQLPPEQLAAFEPKIIGAAVGAGAFAVIQQGLNGTLRRNAAEVQEALNAALPASEELKVDGLPLKKTQTAARKVARGSLRVIKG
jgi:hypothetical protein